MLLDAQNTLSDKQNLAQAIGSYLSTNSIDLGVPSAGPTGVTPISDIGRSDAQLLVQVTEDFTSAGAGTLAFQLVQGSGVDVNGQINAGLTVLEQTPAIALATLKAGYQPRLALPAGIDPANGRYLAMQYAVAGAAMTAGKVSSGLVLDKANNYAI